ncbi:MAG: LLM class flavin-dependent oxidoreductase [Dehalococcoidia bacterium]
MSEAGADGRRPVRFGLWYDFRNPAAWEQPFDRLYAETLEHIQQAEALGFDDIWTSEHHFIEDGYSPSLLPICAAIAARTKRVQIGTNILLLTQHNPLRVAEDAATVDLISGGRFIFGPAVGYKVDEFAAWGIDYHRRGRIMDEALTIVKRAWTEDLFSFHGRHFNFDNVRVTPKPVQKPYPPIWLGAFSEPAIRRAAREGDGLLGVGNPRQAELYIAALKEFGKDWQHPHLAASPRWMAVTEDPDRAWSELGAYALYRAQLYQRWFSKAGMAVAGARTITSVAGLRERNPQLFITPELAIASLRELLATAPIERVFWWAIFPGQRPTDAMHSMELVAKKVIPAFRGPRQQSSRVLR